MRGPLRILTFVLAALLPSLSAAQVVGPTVRIPFVGGSAGSGSGDALVANPLSQFAATSCAQFAGVITGETGSCGSVVLSQAPVFGGTVSFGTASTSTGILRLLHASHAFFNDIQQSASQGASITYTLPIDDGAAGEVLSTNGSGVLDWVADGGGTITSGTTATSGCLDGAPLKSASNLVTCTKMDQTKFVTADQTDTTGAFVDVTDLGFAVAANTVYVFECRFMTNSAASTTGVQIAFNGPASPTNFNYAGIASTSATAITVPTGTTYNSTTGAATGATATQNLQQNFGGTLENGANAGTFTARLQTEVGGSAATIMRGSWCKVWTP